MRLNLLEIKAIIDCKNKIFGMNCDIYLFGSRLDDTQSGGDIDLYLVSENYETNYDKKIDFLICLQEIIGEQKIDLVISKDKTRPIEQEAIKGGVKLDLNEIKLQKYMNECDKHLQRIEEAYSDMKDIFPLSVQKYKNLTKDEVQDIDQYLFRFSKLQDTIGEKIFKLIIQKYYFETTPLPFIDLLNKLEKIEFLTSAKEWINLRKIRNDISHQYDDEPEEMTQALNNIVNQKNIIKDIYLNIKNKSNVT